jgi:hypothetical protein
MGPDGQRASASTLPSLRVRTPAQHGAAVGGFAHQEVGGPNLPEYEPHTGRARDGGNSERRPSPWLTLIETLASR